MRAGLARGREVAAVATVTAYIALGCNLGPRSETLARAVELLDAADGIEVVRVSQPIETEPVGGPADQGAYLNAAAALQTTLSLRELLSALQQIEHALGRRREREVRWGPRTCDLDILLIGERVVDEPGLTIPHARMHERLFVLGPLAEIAPDVVHPVLGKTADRMLRDLRAGEARS